MDKIYPRPHDRQTVYLNSVVTGENIEVGDYTIYNDFANDPHDFEKNNVLYHYPINGDKLKIGRFCSIACGAKFLDAKNIRSAWDNKGDIVLGNDVWVGYEAVIMSGVTIGNGAIIGTRAVVTKDVPPYTIVGGVPAKPIRKRFDDDTIRALENLRWWDWEREKIARSIVAIQNGQLDELEKNA